MNKKLVIIGSVLIVSLILSFPYLKWRWSRWVNYSFDYKGQVEQTIREQVKKECLLDP
jgi:hypothetical protein